MRCYSNFRRGLNSSQKYVGNISKPYVLGLGGIGDMFLFIAKTIELNYPLLKFCPNGNVLDIVKYLMPFFLKDYEILTDLKIHDTEWETLCRQDNCLSWGHLPNVVIGRFYDHWYNNPWSYHTNNAFTKKCPEFLDRFGYIDEPIICIQPASFNTEHKKMSYWLYYKLCHFYIDEGYTVYGIGTYDQWNTQYRLPDDKFHWLSFTQECHNDKWTPIDTEKVFTIINSASRCIGVDSWLKTYAMLVGVTTTVISDQENLFCAPYFWPCELLTFEAAEELFYPITPIDI